VGRMRGLSRSAWMVVGIVMTLVLAPTVAIAATATLVQIKGVQATADHQLLTAPAKPADVRLGFAQLFGNDAENCQTILTPDAGQALVLDHVTLAESVTPQVVDDSEAMQAAEVVELTVDPVDPGCTGFGQLVGWTSPRQPGTETVSLSPGYPVPAGYQLDIRYGFWGPRAVTDATAYGYSVPATDAPATPPPSAHARPDAKRGMHAP
jgi:hypothetical protein